MTKLSLLKGKVSNEQRNLRQQAISYKKLEEIENKIKKKNEKQFFKLIISKDEVEKLEEVELIKEEKIVKMSWYDWNTWLINYIPKPIKNFK